MVATAGSLSFFERGSWPDSERPYELLFKSPDEALASCNFRVVQEHNVPIHDLRPLKGKLSLDREGYVVADLETRMRYEDYFDIEKLQTTFVAELKTLLQSLLGARAVYVHETVIRQKSSSSEPNSNGYGQPIPNAHTDYSPGFGMKLVEILAGNTVEELKLSRVQMLNVWKPLRGPLRSWPLALCDMQSLDRADVVTLDEVHATAVLESQQIMYNPSQKWHYLSEQEATEVIIFKSMDSEIPGEVAHASFSDPTCPESEPPRESIESRVLVVY